MSDNYNVVFSGRLVDGFTLDQARSNLSTMLGIADPVVLDRIFSGQRVLLKKGLSAADAQKHHTALSAAGVACEVVPHAAATAQGEAATSSRTAVADAAAPAVAPRPAITRMEERGEPVKRFVSHHHWHGRRWRSKGRMPAIVLRG